MRFRSLVTADIPFALRLKDAAGWNQTADDWRRFIAFRPAGCFVAEYREQAAGTVTTIDYQGVFGWIGMLLVAPELRGRGIGTALLRTAVASLRDCGTTLLDATPAGRRVYLPMGFEDVEDLQRRVRIAAALPPATAVVPVWLEGSVRGFRTEDLPAVIAFDARAFGAERAQVLAAWLAAAPHLAWIAEQAGRIVGYSLGRRGTRAEQVGPIVAETLAIAAVLLDQAVHAVGDRPVLVDSFVRDPEWLQLLDGLGFVVERPFTRMAFGAKRPLLPEQRLGCINGFAVVEDPAESMVEGR